MEKYKRKKSNPRGDLVEYAATVEAVDQNVGRIFQALEKHGQLENTVIFFFSDNGGDMGQKKGTNEPLKGGKGELFEGGIRVPLAVWNPKWIAGGRKSSVPVMSFDFYPTMLELAGAQDPKDHILDGESLVPLLTGKGTLKRDALYWHFPCYLGKTTPAGAIRQGDYKLIEYFEDGRLELFNLKSDIGETDNLVEEEKKSQKTCTVSFKPGVSKSTPRFRQSSIPTMIPQPPGDVAERRVRNSFRSTPVESKLHLLRRAGIGRQAGG